MSLFMVIQASLILFLSLLFPSEGAISASDMAAVGIVFQGFSSPSIVPFTTYCGQNGVGCDNSSPQRVISLNLTGLGITGTLSLQLGSLTAITSVNLSSNALSGTIPNVFSNLKSLTTLSLRDNLLTGTLPQTLLISSTIQKIDLGLNALTGSLPGVIGVASSLTQLVLGTNQLSNSIPAQLTLLNLNVLDLSENSFTGTVPAGLLSSVSITSLDLHLNNLQGTLPTNLAAPKLTYLDLSQNQFSGTLPTQFGALTTLQTLLLWSNQFSGTLATNFGSLTSLTYFDASKNALIGNIPTQIGSIPTLSAVYLDQNSLDGTLPVFTSSIKTLHLFRNNIIGTIPTQYATIPDLDLSFNLLSGSLPSQFAQNSFTFLYLGGSNTICPLPNFSPWAISSDYYSTSCVSCQAQTLHSISWPLTAAGATAFGVCPAGTIGSPQLTCLTNGSWSTNTTLAVCQSVRCPALSSGNANFNASNALTNVTGTCVSPYVGPIYRLCQSNGTWANAVGACVATAGCAATTYSTYTNFPATLYGVLATGTCVSGSVSSGTPTRLCDGTALAWSSKVSNACVKKP